MPIHPLAQHLLFWLMVLVLPAIGWLPLPTTALAQQPESPLEVYDASILMQNTWRIQEVAVQGNSVSFPALQPMFMSFGWDGAVGAGVSNQGGIGFQATGFGEGRYHLEPFTTDQRCDETWNQQFDQLRALIGTTTAYVVRGDLLWLTGPDQTIQLVLDNAIDEAPPVYYNYAACAAAEAAALAALPPAPDSAAALYAEAMQIPLAEAQRRLEIQAAMSQLEWEVIENEPDYAGSWMEHQPQFGLVIGFAVPNGEALVTKYLDGFAWADLVRVKQMPYRIQELYAIADQIRAVAAQSGINTGSGVNTPEAKVTFYTRYPDELQRYLEAEASIAQYRHMIDYVYDEGAVPATQPADAMPVMLYLPLYTLQRTP